MFKHLCVSQVLEFVLSIKCYYKVQKVLAKLLKSAIFRFKYICL